MGKKYVLSRKIVALLCIIVLMLQFEAPINPVFAKDENKINSIVCNYLVVNNFDMTKNYYISQEFTINGNYKNQSDGHLHFVFNDEGCIGELLISDRGDSFFREQCESVTDLKKKNEAFCIFTNNLNVYILTGEKQILLWGNPEDIVTDTKLSLLRMQNIVLDSVYVDTKYKNTKSVVDIEYDLNVPYIANAASPDTGAGLCWAASTLSMLKYKSLASGYNTAVSLYNYYKNYYIPTETAPYPPGTGTDIVALFSLFGVSVTHGAWGGMTFSYTQSLLDPNNEKPILAGLSGYLGSNLVGHTVVISGYKIFSIEGLNYYYYYKLRDPNNSNIVTVSVNPTATNFSYYTGGVLFDTWEEYFY